VESVRHTAKAELFADGRIDPSPIQILLCQMLPEKSRRFIDGARAAPQTLRGHRAEAMVCPDQQVERVERRCLPLVLKQWSGREPFATALEAASIRLPVTSRIVPAVA